MPAYETNLKTLQLDRSKNSGVKIFEWLLNNNLANEIYKTLKKEPLNNKKNSLIEKTLLSDEAKKLLSSDQLKESINSIYKEDLIFVGAKLITLSANKKPDWDFHLDLYFKQRAFDKGCTIWIPLAKNLDDNKDILSVSILPKHFGFCDPLYKQLNFLEKLEMSFSNDVPNYKKQTDSKLQNLWSEVLSAHLMSKIFNKHCYNFNSKLSRSFLCDKQALINFEYVSNNNNAQCTLIGFTFYSEHSVFKYRGLDKEDTNSCILKSINHFINDGIPIIDLPIFKGAPCIKAKPDSIDLNKIKEKFDPRICFD